MTALSRPHLQEAVAYIAARKTLFGEATAATAIEVLEERLAALPEEAPERETAASPLEEQRKQVTILFAAIDGFTRLAGATRNTARLRQIDLLWQRLDETIVNHGGIVDKHMGDVIMGIFGAPIARENDPERAVRCAMALRELVAQFLADQKAAAPDDPSRTPHNAVMRIGINTGQVSLGPVGSDYGLTAIGDAVNVASRLKEAASESGLYISHDTYRLIHNLFRVEPLGEVSIKGRQTPVTVYRVVGGLPRLFFPATEGVEGVHVPMIGRSAELGLLRESLNWSAREGRGGVVTILGDAGVGKSRLVREFHRHLTDYPMEPAVFQARCDQRLTGVSFSLLRDMFVRHFGIEEGDRGATIEGKISKGLSDMLPHGRFTQKSATRQWAQAIGLLLGLDTPAGQTRSWDRSELVKVRDQALEGILTYLDAVTRRSPVTLMFLEDVHWADEDSLALLERMAATAAERPLLMFCLARPMFLERRPGWPGEHPVGALHLPLRPLDEAYSRELVLNILRKLTHIPPALSDLIVRSAAGNPYYVEELVRVLIEDGIIVPDGPAWYLRPRELTRLRVPGTLTGVLQARLDHLPELERVTLQQAAVIGDEFWAGAIHTINRAGRFSFTEEQVDAALHSLERRDMIVRASAPTFAGSPAYLFRHTVLREVAYESVLLRDRPGYHWQAVRWLESQVGERTDDYAAPIAQHYEQAGRPADAARMYEQAAARAADQFKLTVAIDYYRKALELLKNMPQYLDMRLGVLERMGRLLQRRGRLVEALDAYGAMHDNAELDGNILGQARAKNAQAAIFLELANNLQAIEAALDAEQLARLTGADMELALAQLIQGEAAGRMGDRARAVKAGRQAIERGRSLDAPQGMARALALLATFADEAEERRRAVDELQALAEDLKRGGLDDEAAYALEKLGASWLALDQPQEAREALERALAWQRAAKAPRVTAEVLRLTGIAACRMNDTGSAIGLLEEAEALADSAGDRYQRLACRLAVGESLLARGQHLAAEATLRQVIAAAEDRQRLGSWVHLGQAYTLLIEVLTRQGRLDEARLVAAEE